MSEGETSFLIGLVLGVALAVWIRWIEGRRG